ncbi:MAG TPA: hypothetical protein VGP47_11545 [Parachlamydiaceae bacterium]|nr:hypothetical protein [Nitrosopumilus sp.]HEV8053119.1 hypothetical protein [Parachlamydiaceae bacterium]
MNHIEVVNNVTSSQWELVYADKRLSDSFNSKQIDHELLANNLENRVNLLCNLYHLPIPNKIVITHDKKFNMMNTGELYVDSLNFVFSAIDRNSMSARHQTIYQRIEDYLIEKEALLKQKEEFLVKNEKLDSDKLVAYETAENELLGRYKIELGQDLKDYQEVFLGNELDEMIVSTLAMHKAARYNTITPLVTKVAIFSLAALNGMITRRVVSTLTTLPISNIFGFLVSLSSCICLYNAEKIARVAAMTFDNDLKTLLIKPWNDRTFESKIWFCKNELI